MSCAKLYCSNLQFLSLTCAFKVSLPARTRHQLSDWVTSVPDQGETISGFVMGSTHLTVPLSVVALCIVHVTCSGQNATHVARGSKATAINGYDLDRAEDMAMLSSIAYCTDEIKTWTCPYCKNPRASDFKPYSVLLNTSTDTHGYIAVSQSRRQVIVAFRGTQDLENWITNLNFLKKPDTNIKLCLNETAVGLVHGGFYEAYLSVQMQMRQSLHELQATAGGYELIVIGHSLGAALATLAAADLACAPILGQPVVYNYGSPRVGDKTFSDFATKTINIYRHTHWKDIVPHVPPEDVFGFWHVGNEHFLQETWGMCTTCVYIFFYLLKLYLLGRYLYHKIGCSWFVSLSGTITPFEKKRFQLLNFHTSTCVNIHSGRMHQFYPS